MALSRIRSTVRTSSESLAPASGLVIYVSLIYMSDAVDAALKKGTAELLVLAQLEDGARHGYEIGQQIAARGAGAVSFQPASLYPVLYRLERRGLITGRWVEKANQRRRRYYRLTAKGRRVLADRRSRWRTFMQAIQQAAGVGYA
jgi:PadR family transcriptional regulator, regulatory protein PadR